METGLGTGLNCVNAAICFCSKAMSHDFILQSDRVRHRPVELADPLVVGKKEVFLSWCGKWRGGEDQSHVLTLCRGQGRRRVTIIMQ